MLLVEPHLSSCKRHAPVRKCWTEPTPCHTGADKECYFNSIPKDCAESGRLGRSRDCTLSGSQKQNHNGKVTQRIVDESAPSREAYSAKTSVFNSALLRCRAAAIQQGTLPMAGCRIHTTGITESHSSEQRSEMASSQVFGSQPHRRIAQNRVVAGILPGNIKLSDGRRLRACGHRDVSSQRQA